VTLNVMLLVRQSKPDERSCLLYCLSAYVPQVAHLMCIWLYTISYVHLAVHYILCTSGYTLYLMYIWLYTISYVHLAIHYILCTSGYTLYLMCISGYTLYLMCISGYTLYLMYISGYTLYLTINN